MDEHFKDVSPVSDNGYDLAPKYIKDLTAELLETQPPDTDSRFVCYKFDGANKFADLGRSIESTVFNDTFDNDPDEMQKEYGPYEAQSTFFVSVDRETKTPTGVLRIIEDGPAGLKTINDIADPKKVQPTIAVDDIQQQHGIKTFENCWDIATVAVPPEYRSAKGAISVQLFRAVYVAAMDAGMQHVVSIIDEKALNKLTGYLSVPFVPLAGSKSIEYLGSDKSHAVYCSVPDFYKSVSSGRWWRPKKLLARHALGRLLGSQDEELQFKSQYKK